MDAQDNNSDNVDIQVQPVVQSTPHVRRDVHKAAQVVRNLADRVGHVNGNQDVPRAIQQQWSAFNVPSMWAAAAGDDTCPVLQWLASAAQHVESMFVAGSIVSGHDAAVVGWEALSEVMRSWDIRSREDLSEWIHRQGFPRPRWGAHITARAQERILTMAGAVDAREWVGSSVRAGGVVGVRACPCQWNQSCTRVSVGPWVDNDGFPRDVP